jgi:TusA-related sulfurtransferase
MAGGIPIRFRRTVNEQPVDPTPIGVGMWHMLDNKLGIMTENGMCWYPGIDTKKKLMVLNQGQRLTGKTDAGATNNLVIDFATNGTIRIVNIDTDEVIATFSEAGVVLTDPVVEEVVGGGSLHKGSHPGFIPQLFSTTAKDSDNFQGFVGPNTYMWKKATGGLGRMQVRLSSEPGGGEMTHWSAEAFTLEVKVLTALQNAGLRSWFFEPALANDGFANKNKHFISIKGPQGQGNTIRIGRAGVYASTAVLGTGQWQRIALDIPVHSRTNSFVYNTDREPYAVDWFFNTTGGTWFISEPTVQEVETYVTELYQYKTLGERLALADAYFWKSPSLYMEAARKKSVVLPLSLPHLHDNATYDVVAEGNLQAINVTEKNRRGFVLNTLDSNPAAQWSTKLTVGYRGPLTDIA